jgi:hypothetical protein
MTQPKAEKPTPVKGDKAAQPKAEKAPQRKSVAYTGNRRSENNRRISVVIGVVMIVAMVGSSLIPLFNLNTANPAALPTSTAAPTLPPPIADLETITFNRNYLHPSGLFTVGIPSGWETSGDNSTITEAQTTMRNSTQVSVIEVRLIDPEPELNTAEDLRQIFTEEWLNSSWREYTSWTQTSGEVVNDRLVLDFNLRRTNQDYISRQIAYINNGRAVSVRVIAPPNASEMLRYVVEKMLETVQPVTEFAGTPLDWQAYFDAETDHIIRYPATWTLADSAPGLPASIQADTVALRVETVATTLADETAATTYVESLRSGTTVKSVEAVERDGFSGFQVAYTLTDADGNINAGLAVLLNGDNQAHVANIRVLNSGDVDLNADEAATTYADVITSLGTFTLMPNLNLGAEAEAEATPEQE